VSKAGTHDCVPAFKNSICLAVFSYVELTFQHVTALQSVGLATVEAATSPETTSATHSRQFGIVSLNRLARLSRFRVLDLIRRIPAAATANPSFAPVLHQTRAASLCLASGLYRVGTGFVSRFPPPGCQPGLK
jgi:hypothetical protein